MQRRAWLWICVNWALALLSVLPWGASRGWGAQRSPKKPVQKKEQTREEPKGESQQREPEVHWPKDLSKLQGLEVEHVPLLEVTSPEGKEESFQLLIRVGQKAHPMDTAHFLKRVEVWIDDVKNCDLVLQPADLLPRWQLGVRKKPKMQVTVKAECNLHGVWANRLVI